jgi:hypothetical protein
MMFWVEVVGQGSSVPSCDEENCHETILNSKDGRRTSGSYIVG